MSKLHCIENIIISDFCTI